MENIVKFLILVVILVTFSQCQDDTEEFTFGGAADEDVEKPEIKLTEGDNGKLEKYEIQFIFINCEVSKPPSDLGTDNIRWVDNSGSIISSTKLLFIRSVLKKNEGMYYCIVERSNSKFNKSFLLTVKEPSISISIMAEERLMINGRIYRKCSDLGIPSNTINDELTYEWVNSKKEVVSNMDMLDLPIPDTSVGGTYECRLKSQNTGKVFTTTTDVMIKSQGRSTDAYKLNIILSPLILKYKEPFSIKCEVPNFAGRIQYQWFRGEDLIGTEQTIRMESFDQKSSGTYKCKAKIFTPGGNLVLTGETTQQFTIFQEGKIELAEKPGPKLFVHQGDKKELHCEIESSTGLRGKDAQWYINGKRFLTNKPDNVQRYDQMFVSMLIIDNIDLKNEGNYECRVGDSAKEVNIFVLISPGVIQTSPSILKVLEGEEVEFHCRVDNIPNVKNVNLKWRFQNKQNTVHNPILGSRWRIQNSKLADLTSFISLNQAKLSDSGYYICTEPNGLTTRSELIVIPNKDFQFITITPRLINTRPKTAFQIECFSKNSNGQPIGKPEFKFTNDSPVKNDPQFTITTVGPAHIKLEARNGLEISDNNLEIVCSNGISNDKSRIIIITTKSSCSPGFKACKNGQCVENNKFCDGNRDCFDGSDEDPTYCILGSQIITITPKFITTRPNKPFQIECYSKNSVGQPIGKPEFLFTNGRPIKGDSRFRITDEGSSHIKLEARNGLESSDNNLEIVCSNGISRESSKVTINSVCPPGYRYCRNGKCLENGKFCDGVKDCTDGSDENPVFCKECDPISKKCEYFNNKSPKRNYYLIHWGCDGEEDCGNGYDEDVNTCSPFYLTNCGGKLFTCKSGLKIPRGYLCDSSQDCPDGDDEMGCSYPQIIKNSGTNLKIRKSNSVTLSCEARGIPLPTITWRFNWKCAPTNDRFKVSFYSANCSTVVSTLTIDNFQPGDDGIYNCEALSSRQRAFSNDFQVVLQNN